METSQCAASMERVLGPLMASSKTAWLTAIWLDPPSLLSTATKLAEMINNRGVSSQSKAAELQSPHRTKHTQQTLKPQGLPKPDQVQPCPWPGWWPWLSTLPPHTSWRGGAEQADASAAPQEKPPLKLHPLRAFPPWPLFWEWLENVSRALGAGGGGSGKRKKRWLDFF